MRSFNHLLWPAVCANCVESISETDEGLCRRCWSELMASVGGDYCRYCGVDVSRYALYEDGCARCQGKAIYFDAIARGGVYEAALRKMIVAFKLAGRTELDSILGFLGNSALEGSGFYERIDFFVPVPLHWTRRITRGYNHAHIIAKKLRHDWAKVNTDLVRTRRTKTQTAMASVTERAKNVAEAFAVRKGHKFTGRNICIVDDIKTTGATLNECAKTLKHAGAAKVFALVLAVAGQKA